MLSARFLLSRPVRRTYKPGGPGRRAKAASGCQESGRPFESQAQAAKRGIENTIPRRLSSLTFTSTLGSQSKRATI